MAWHQSLFAGWRRNSLRSCYRSLPTTCRTFSAHSIDSIHNNLCSFRKILDGHIVGQESAKEAVLLGLLAREHVYIEGPPGVAKTYIAELLSESTGLSHWFYQLHRDSRLNELIGEAVITKDTTPTRDIIRQDIIPGGILTCELAVLDDISRAPGEALNVLLRILNERKYGAAPANRIPLLSAIATGNPAQDDAYFAEPLDPATLDRFALQVRVKGLINEGNWPAVSDVLDMYAGPPPGIDADMSESRGRDIIIKGGDFVPQVVFGESVKRVLMELLRVLHEDHELGEGNSLLTDRTFLIKAVKVLKANAVLNGRLQCEPHDLFAMRHLTTFRLPEKVHEQICDIIAQVLANHAPFCSPPAGEEPGEASGDCAREQAPQSGGEEKEPGTQSNEPNEHRFAESKGPESLDCVSQGMAPCLKASSVTTRDASDVQNLQSFLQGLKGKLDEGTAVNLDNPGGQPRSWARLRAFSDIVDADLSGAAMWCESPGPHLPRCQRRVRRRLGGRMAIIRDTSLSMMGPNEIFATKVCEKIVELAKRFRMHVGYLEFNDNVTKFVLDSSRKFFSREYPTLLKQVSWARSKGCTNYETPLNVALSEFQRMNGKRMALAARFNQHIVFLTDGHPNRGDCTLARQIRSARDAQISIHTIFVGTLEGDQGCPTVLDAMSLSTKGSRYIAQYVPGTVDIRVETRS